MSQTLQDLKRHIAFYGFRGGPGGISHVMHNLINALADENCQIDVVLNDMDIPELAELHDAVHIFSVGKGSLFNRAKALARYLDNKKPEVLLTNHRERANREAVLAKRISRWGGLLAFRIGNTLTEMEQNRNLFKKYLLSLSVRYCYAKADMVIANSNGVGQDVLKVARIPVEKLRVIRNATVTEALCSKAVEPLAHPWFKEGAPPVITGLGRLARQKGFDVLLSAFAIVRAERPCRLVIIGSGKEQDNLRRLASKFGIQDDLDLVGYDPNPFRYLYRAKLFVLSSYWEGSPNALIEALALGVPVVATDCHSGPRDILCGGKYGPLVPVGRAEELAEAMKRVLDAPASPAVLQEAAVPFQAKLSAMDYIKTLYNG